MEAADRNGALRRTVATTLKRHKAFSIFNSLSERHSERVPLETFARELSQAFPAVDAQHKTWVIYGRAFAAWFEYAGLAVFKDNELCLPGDDFVGLGSLLSSAAKVPTRASGYLQGAPGPAQRLLLRISEFDLRNQDLNRGEQRAMHDLLLLGFVNVKSDAILGAAGSLESGAMSKSFLGAALRRLPALSSALDLLDRDPAADNKALGECIRGAIGADWRDSTTELSGKQFRSWAKAAGFVSERARFRARRSDPTEA